MHPPTDVNGKYRPDVDGLRAVSVIGVILFHGGLGFPGGYVGVDVFFVISGFLITRIIHDGLERKTFTFADFWARRVRRILPASLAMSLVVLLVGSVVLLPYDMQELGEATFAHGVFASNVYHWQQLKDYFGSEADLRPLLHTWSLGVEEQFYFLYPFLLYLLRGCGHGTRILVLSAIVLGSLLASVLGVHSFPYASFFLLPTRAWELAAGGLIALWGMPSSVGPRLRQVLGILGLGCILVAMLFFSEHTPFPGYAALLPVLGAVLVIVAGVRGETLTFRFLSLRPVVFVGLLSYSLYLWHWPLLVFARYVFGESIPGPVLAGVLVLTALLSLLSWRFVEVPFRRAGSQQAPAKVIATGLSIASVVCLISLAIFLSGGWPGRLAGNKLATEDAQFGNSEYFRGEAAAVQSGLPVIGCTGTNCLPGHVLLWGDSHATPVVQALDAALKAAGLRGLVAARSSDAPIIESRSPDSEASRWNNAVLSYLESGEVSAVIIVSRWSSWLKQDAAFASVEDRLSRVTRKGIGVYVMSQVPEQGLHVSRALHVARFGGPAPAGSTLAHHLDQQRVANSYLARLEAAGVRLVDSTPFCFDESGLAIVGGEGRAYYRDDDHLSSYGAERLLEPLFRQVANEINQRK